MRKATFRQRAKMLELAIFFDDDITFAEAAELIRAAIPQVGRSIDPKKIESAVAVESEGDPGPGRQWEA